MLHEIATAPPRPISSVDGLITNAVSRSFSLATDDAFWNPSRMHRSRVSAPLAAALLLASSVGVSVIAQGLTDFSGTWTLAPPERAAGVARGAAPPALSAHGDMGSGWGSEITITQDQAALTVVYTYFHPRDMHPPFTFKYPLNGSAVSHTVNMGRGPQEQVSKTSWRGAALAISTTHRFANPADGQATTIETTQVLSLESPSTLVIETTRPGVPRGAPSSTTRTTYRKR
jgi:hypothetical protein